MRLICQVNIGYDFLIGIAYIRYRLGRHVSSFATICKNQRDRLAKYMVVVWNGLNLWFKTIEAYSYVHCHLDGCFCRVASARALSHNNTVNVRHSWGRKLNYESSRRMLSVWWMFMCVWWWRANGNRKFTCIHSHKHTIKWCKMVRV